MISKDKKKEPNILFYCSWGGFGHVARSYSIISKLPENGKYTVVTPEKWPFEKPNKNFYYKKIHEPKSRIRLNEENLIVQDYEKGANDKEGYKKHLHEYIETLKDTDPDLVVVDNPAEVSLITKMMGYKTVVIYESLETEDLRWRLSWKNMDKVLAPYPKSFLKKAKFPYLENTFCSGGLTKYDERKKPTKEEAIEEIGLNKEKEYLLLTVGKGRKSQKIIQKVIKGVRNLNYEVLLMYPREDDFTKKMSKSYSHCHHVSNVYDKMNLYLSAVDVIVTGSGYNSIMEACYFRKPTIAVPLERIYKEQLFKAKILSDMNAIEFINPKKINEKSLTEKLKILDDKKKVKVMKKSQEKIVDGQGSRRAANMLTNLAKNI